MSARINIIESKLDGRNLGLKIRNLEYRAVIITRMVDGSFHVNIEKIANDLPDDVAVNVIVNKVASDAMNYMLPRAYRTFNGAVRVVNSSQTMPWHAANDHRTMLWYAQHPGSSRNLPHRIAAWFQVKYYFG